MSDNRRARPAVIDFTPKHQPDQEEDRPKVWKANHLSRARIKKWLAKQRIPRPGVTVLVGDEGIGKSLFWVWIVAAVTTGKPLLEFGIPGRDPQHVRLVVTEDDWATEVRPRLVKAGADLQYVTVIARDRDGSGTPVFPSDDMALLYQDPIPALIVVDAWLDTVPASLDVQRPQDARKALRPWRNTAIQLDASVLLVTHTNRDKSGKARDKYGVTGELRKAARMTLFAQRDERKRLVIGPEKANGTAIMSASIFTIEAVKVRRATDEDDGTVPVLRYEGESDQNAGELVEPKDASPEAQFLIEFLNDGPKQRSDVFNTAEQKGFKAYRIYQEADKLNLSRKREEFGGPTMWSLPR